MRFLCCVLMPAALLAQTDPYAATWINEKADGNIPQVSVRRDANRVMVHAWGRCSPVDCDWGEAMAQEFHGTQLATWNQGFSTTSMHLMPQPDGRLLIACRTTYHDERRGTDSASAELFKRGDEVKLSPEEDAARALLGRAAEAYKGLRNVRFESTRTTTRKADTSAVRTVRRSTIQFAGPARLRIESSIRGETQLIIADGATVWTVYPDSNTYTKTPQGQALSSLPVIGLYTLLDKMRGTPRLAGREIIEGAQCDVIQIEREHGASQKLWIDARTHLVRRDMQQDANGITDVVFQAAHLHHAPGAHVFAYDPALTNAQDRRQLTQQAPETLTGKPAPDFVLGDLDGKTVRLADLRGKAVILDFWATWCGPCREALPVLELLHRTFADRGLVVLGVNTEGAEIARGFLSKEGYTLRSLTDAKERVTRAYQVVPLPTTVVIDREGRITLYEVGASPAQLRDAVSKLGPW